MIRHILLDLDDTLLDFRWAEREALKKTLSQLGAEAEDAALGRYSAINEALWKRLERGEIRREALKRERFRLFFAEYGIEADPDEAARLYEENISHGHRFVDGAPALLAALRERGCRLYLVSNGTTRVQHGRIASAGIAPCFDGIFLSQEIGADKPAPAFFRAVFASIPGFRAEETLILGDSLSSDIRGGHDAGIRTVWLDRRGKGTEQSGVTPDHTIRRLADLPPLLDRLDAPCP